MHYNKIFTPLSWLYGIVIWLRNWLYDLRILSVRQLPVSVISIDSVTGSGSGKTSFLEYLIEYLLPFGKKIAIVHFADNHSTGMDIISDGGRIYGTPRSESDGLYQIAIKYPQVIVVVSDNVMNTAELVIERFRPSVILLDGCFHLRSVKRDLDIVMIDSTKSLTGTAMIPAGPRREPLSALRRAHLLVYSHTSATSSGMLNTLKKYTHSPAAGIQYQPIELVQLFTGNILELDSIANKPVVAFCGIANPNSFQKILQEIGAQIVNFIVYPNHHIYQRSDFQAIQQKFDSRKAQCIVTTEKDAVRLQSHSKIDAFPYDSCYFLRIKINLVSGQSTLHYLLKEKIDSSIR